jgi:hypothetical protein
LIRSAYSDSNNLKKLTIKQRLGTDHDDVEFWWRKQAEKYPVLDIEVYLLLLCALTIY